MSQMICANCGTPNEAGRATCSDCEFPLVEAEELAYASALPVGTRLQNGRYEVRGTLGRGGFAYLYLGWDENLQGEVAIKEYFPNDDRLCVRAPGTRRVVSGARGEDFAESRRDFLREARLLLRLRRHSGVVGVLDCFEEAAHGTAYLVLDRIEGETLEARIRRVGALDAREVERLAVALAQTLAFLHGRDVLHRDLSPGNVMLDGDGHPVLIDFGLAREYLVRRGSTVVGYTDGYAPPEQYRADAQRGTYSDLYSLGAVLWFALSGAEPPRSTDRVLEQLVGQGLRLPKGLRAPLRTALEASLELDYSNRVRRAEDFLRLLGVETAGEPLLDGVTVASDPDLARDSFETVEEWAQRLESQLWIAGEARMLKDEYDIETGRFPLAWVKCEKWVRRLPLPLERYTLVLELSREAARTIYEDGDTWQIGVNLSLDTETKRCSVNEVAKLLWNKGIVDIRLLNPNAERDAFAGIGFEVSSDGTLKDLRTGLRWRRYCLGQAWESGIKQGVPALLSLAEVCSELERVNELSGNGFGFWRLPTKDELEALLSHDRVKRIEAIRFPEPDCFPIWTKSKDSSREARKVIFGNGFVCWGEGGAARGLLVWESRELPVIDYLKFSDRVGNGSGMFDGQRGRCDFGI